MSPLSPSLFLKPPVPGLGGWLVPAAGQGLVSPGYPSEMMGNVVMHGQPLGQGPWERPDAFPKFGQSSEQPDVAEDVSAHCRFGL